METAQETQETLELLKTTQPFSGLPAEELRSLAAEATQAFYPAGHVILRQQGPAAEHLSVIRSGSVRVFLTTNEREDVLLDHRGPGGTFGLLSLIRGDRALNTVAATEDTSCCRITKAAVLRLMERNAAFSEFYLRYYLTRLTDLMHRQIQDRSLLYGGGDKLLFTYRLEELASREIVRAPAGITIREAAQLMSRRRISSLLLEDDAGLPAGIVTDRDLRDRVLADGRSADDPVGSVMSVTLIKSDAGDYCFEALLKMVRFNIHHLLVASGGALTGIITNHDLMMLQSAYPLAVARDIENQDTVEGLAIAQRAIDRLIDVLVREGSRASTVTRIITEVNDRLVRRLLEIIEGRLGPPPVRYCWIAFGSEGRKEQTFRTDQDNALIYEDPPAGAEERCAAYFEQLGLAMRDALVRCGFPPCPADYMASNPRWRRPLADWKAYIRKWVATPTPEAVLFCLIFFDFRPLHGESLLAENLRAAMTHALKGGRLFLTRMAATALQNRPPLGAFGRFRTERTGPHRGRLNLKLNGLTPIIDAVRIAALQAHLYSTSTLDRLRELRGAGSFAAPHARELEEAFEFLMGLRLRHQYERRLACGEADNFIAPGELGSLEAAGLRESLRRVRDVQAAITEQYRLWMVP